jgi:hypothetical protein
MATSNPCVEKIDDYVEGTRSKTQRQEVCSAIFYRERQYSVNGCVITMDLHVRNLLSTEEGYELWRRDYNCYDPVFVVEMKGKEGSDI